MAGNFVRCVGVRCLVTRLHEWRLLAAWIEKGLDSDHSRIHSQHVARDCRYVPQPIGWSRGIAFGLMVFTIAIGRYPALKQPIVH